MDEHLLFEQRSHPIDVWSFANALVYCFIQRSSLTTCAQVRRCFWGGGFFFNVVERYSISRFSFYVDSILISTLKVPNNQGALLAK